MCVCYHDCGHPLLLIWFADLAKCVVLKCWHDKVQSALEKEGSPDLCKLWEKRKKCLELHVIWAGSVGFSLCPQLIVFVLFNQKYTSVILWGCAVGKWYIALRYLFFLAVVILYIGRDSCDISNTQDTCWMMTLSLKKNKVHNQRCVYQNNTWNPSRQRWIIRKLFRFCCYCDVVLWCFCFSSCVALLFLERVKDERGIWLTPNHWLVSFHCVLCVWNDTKRTWLLSGGFNWNAWQ